jgi:hypothetical protein
MPLETFHVYCRIRSAQHFFVLMARSAADARQLAEADGHDVFKVRRAPRPAGNGAPIHRRF